MNILNQLPQVNFTELNPREVEHLIITSYENLHGNTLYPGDPVRLFLESLAYIITLQNTLIDEAGKQNLLAYAKEPHLDHLGALMNTPRLEPMPAITTMRYILKDKLDWPVVIPAKSRVGTSEGKLIFLTDNNIQIEPGQLFADVTATCIEVGQQANNLVPGQINRMVDPIAYIDKVHNINLTNSGCDLETDDDYRLRIQLAPEHFSVAGPEGAYRYHALSVHPEIQDCSIFSPKPGYVDVRPIMKGGHLPSEEILELVRKKLNDKFIRPLTDTVIVKAPEEIFFEIKGGWYLRQNDEPLAENRKKQVDLALQNFITWQSSLPGRDINPTKLISLIEQAGAKRVVLEQPGFVTIHPWQIARKSLVSFEFFGVEND